MKDARVGDVPGKNILFQHDGEQRDHHFSIRSAKYAGLLTVMPNQPRQCIEWNCVPLEPTRHVLALRALDMYARGVHDQFSLIVLALGRRRCVGHRIDHASCHVSL